MFGRLVTPDTMLARISGAMIIFNAPMNKVGPNRSSHHSACV